MSKPGFDEKGFPLNVPAASREINRICGRRGHIAARHEEQLRGTDEDLQDDYRQKALTLREVYARYTKTVAEQLYSSRFRLIYELLQNGDDARYAEGVEPTVTFRIKPTELIIETNERGFSLGDVEAICDTGKSSKIGNSDTTGEKGLGFKSVFGIADYVHIQSGLWSFRFEHKRGEDGVGMITPIWTDVVTSLPAGVGTKCTLRYSDTRDNFYQRLISEFERLPKTTIFALRQVRRMVVVVERADGRSDHITFTKDGDLSSEEMQISTMVTGQFGDHRSEKTRLRCFEHTVIDLPSESQRTNAASDVTVAFEVNLSGTPVVPPRGQHVFAYLPVQRVPHLPFLIHANFVLAANREAVPDTDWNQALRQGIVTAFVEWVMKVVTPGDELEYKWMRYLPGTTIEGFWGDLYDDIKYELLRKAILRSRRGRLHNLRHLRILPHWFFYEGLPLLPDTEADIYLSDRYEPQDVKTLKELGLGGITAPELLTRMKLGLSASEKAGIHDRPLDDPWHTRFGVLVHWLLQIDYVKLEVENLNIIPLNNNGWVSPSSLRRDPVYLPYIIDEDAVRIEVPDGLGIRKLHPTAAADGERASFYMSLGIASCPHYTVTQKILEGHESSGRRGNVLTFLRDLEILFWFGQPTSQSSVRHTRLRLVSDENMQHRGRSLFFPSDNEYHSEKLLAATLKKDLSDCGYGILDSRYMESQVRKHIRHDLDWISWLQKCGISYFPPLTEVRSGQYKLNPLMSLIARDNSKSFVANLKEHWSDYRVGAARITKHLKMIDVPCRNGTHKELGETILPVQQLVEKSKELQMEEVLPFLELPPESDIQQSDTWSFLKDFGVICELDTSFFLKAVRLLTASTQTQLIPVCTSIYAGIAQTTNLGDTATVQKMFSDQPLIRTHTPAEVWCRSTDCIWDGPIFLRAKKVPHPVYGADRNASVFFKTILSMRDVEYRDLIDELNIFASGTNEASSFEDKLYGIYKLLAEMTRSESTIEAVRQEFNARGLIFVRQRWLKPSECLWNCTIAISGRVPLEQVYPKLKKFFVDKMKVMTMNIDVLVQELARTAKKTAPDFDEIKRIILAIGQLLAADPEVKIKDEFLNTLKKTAFLPVCCPDGMRPFSIDEHFFINDHKRYGESFRHKARIVDFCHEEMTSLHPFFELLGIRHRYLSNHVRPVTTCHRPTESIPLGRHIRDRAYGFSCCANFYNSPRYYNRNTTTHQLLLNTEVYVCEEMWTELTVRQEGDQDISVRSDRAVVKVDDEVDGKLALYVPSDHDGLYSCFHTELPGQLARLLAIQDRAAVKVIHRILNDKDLDKTMKDEDLCYYEWFDRPEPLQTSSPFPAPNGAEGPTVDLTSIPPTIPDEALLVVLADQSSHASYTQDTNNVPAPVSVNYAPQDSVWEQVARNEQYKKLLREVVRQARRGQPPQGGSLSLYEIDQALDELDNRVDYAGFFRTFGGTGNGNFEHNARIGAAGELFVFELLKSSRVSDFSIDNWQSSIRHYVRELPEYANEPAWSGREISDIMYEGNCPRLMDILRRNTTFPYPPWLGSRATPAAVRYHIEVKTTGGPCSTPFFMSGNQYRLMREKACEPHSPRAPIDLFVIMRVFNLFSSNIGLQVYINPWHLRDVALDFVADPWKVVPSEGI